jgi:hypothetical protein
MNSNRYCLVKNAVFDDICFRLIGAHEYLSASGYEAIL